MNLIKWVLNTFNGQISANVLGLVRHLATGSGGYLLAHGIITKDQLSGWIGSVYFLGGIGFSILDKYVATGKIAGTIPVAGGK